jgi:hypothetical protein
MRLDQLASVASVSGFMGGSAADFFDLPCNAQCPECGARETDISFDEGDAVNPSPLHKVEFGRFYLVDDQNNARVLSHFVNTCRVCRYRWLSRTPSTEVLFEDFANGKVGASFEDWDDKEAVKSNAYAFLLKGKRYAADHSDFAPNVESQMQMVEAYLDAEKPQAFVVNVREGLRCVVMTTVEGSPIAGITKLPKDCVDVSRILGPEWRHPK